MACVRNAVDGKERQKSMYRELGIEDWTSTKNKMACDGIE